MVNNKGQVLVEYILLLALTVFLATAVSQSLKRAEIGKKLAQNPLNKLSGMIESGLWLEPEKARLVHPNHLSRGVSYAGDKL